MRALQRARAAAACSRRTACAAWHSSSRRTTYKSTGPDVRGLGSMSHASKIFISHSAHDDKDRLILDELEKRLWVAGFQPFCDRKRLLPGDTWRNELYAAIGCCHAAVVLLT